MQSHDDEQFSGTEKLGLARQLQVQLLVTDALCTCSSDKETDDVTIYCMYKGIYMEVGVRNALNNNTHRQQFSVSTPR